MKKKFTLIAILLSLTAFSQKKKFDQYSLEAGYGLGVSGTPSISEFSHFEVGFRYMLDEYWGIKFDFGSDRFIASDNPETGTRYNRYSVQGVHNLGRTLNFRELTGGSINLLAHAGLGYSSLKSLQKDKIDRIGNVIIGLTPQIKIMNNLAFHLDTSFILNFTQHYNFDGVYPTPGKAESFTGNLFNVSAGLTFYFGKNGSDPDWR